MKYTVIWKPIALQKLAGIWLAAEDKETVNRAVREIDRYLEHGAAVGEEFVQGTRLLVAPPLIVVYEISHTDCQATVSNVVSRP